MSSIQKAAMIEDPDGLVKERVMEPKKEESPTDEAQEVEARVGDSPGAASDDRKEMVMLTSPQKDSSGVSKGSPEIMGGSSHGGKSSLPKGSSHGDKKASLAREEARRRRSGDFKSSPEGSDASSNGRGSDASRRASDASRRGSKSSPRGSVKLVDPIDVEAPIALGGGGVVTENTASGEETDFYSLAHLAAAGKDHKQSNMPGLPITPPRRPTQMHDSSPTKDTADTDEFDGSSVGGGQMDSKDILADEGFNSTLGLPSSPSFDEDPFAPRKGKCLEWQYVCMSLKSKKSKDGEDGDKRMLLNNVWGEVPAKQTTAIMGPSGAGKTSLLNILSGRCKTKKNLEVTADIRVNNTPVFPADDIKARKMIAYVEQHDSLNVTSTPREAIRFSAKLRLPKSTTNQELDRLAMQMIRELGLSSCADTLIGGRMVKGLSGGERKRTSVGVELVVKPALVFLDEPTSGLDSFSAVQLCQVLKKVANAGAAVLFTIHQPSSTTFNSFDRLILLNRGLIMYQGLVKDIPNAFASKGYAIPNRHNPADFILDVAQGTPIDELQEAGFFPYPPELPPPPEDETPSKAFGRISLRYVTKEELIKEPKAGFGTQLKMLLKREMNHIRRSFKGLKARFGLTAFMSSLIGLISLGVGSADRSDASNLNSMFGGLMMAALTNVFTVVLPALITFPEERPVFVREYSTSHYSVFAYFISRMAVEATIIGGQVLLSCTLTYLMIGFMQPFFWYYVSIYLLAIASTAMGLIIGSSVDDPSMAIEFLPPLFVPQILFAGFFVKPELIPAWLRWVRYSFPLTYTVRILLVQEFDDNCGDGLGEIWCERLLKDVDADPDDVVWYWIVLAALFVFFRMVALYILQRRAGTF